MECLTYDCIWNDIPEQYRPDRGNICIVKDSQNRAFNVLKNKYDGWLVLLNPNEDQQVHMSDCARHNMPAMPNGPCDCGADDIITLALFWEKENASLFAESYILQHGKPGHAENAQSGVPGNVVRKERYE